MYSFSFLLPTRKKLPMLYRLFRSIVDNTSELSSLEIVLGVDYDDKESWDVEYEGLNIKKVYFTKPKVFSLSALFEECFKASTGRFVMMMNDDVVIRTRAWDEIILNGIKDYKDDIFLVRVNGLALDSSDLACHPIVSRRASKEIGFTESAYKRYFPDDHIYDIYNRLSIAGFSRILYFSNVIFEHVHDTINEDGKVVFIEIDPKKYKVDYVLFFSKEKIEDRNSKALKLIPLIDKDAYKQHKITYKNIINGVKHYSETGSFMLCPQDKQAIKADKSKAQYPNKLIFISSRMDKRANKSLKSIRDNTSNYSLKIIDKSKSLSFRDELFSCISSSTEEYLSFVFSGAVVEPDWFLSFTKSFTKNTAVVGSSCSFLGIDVFSESDYSLGVDDSVFVLKRSLLKDISPSALFLDGFLGLDISLQAWSLGYKVKLSGIDVKYSNALLPSSYESTLKARNIVAYGTYIASPASFNSIEFCFSLLGKKQKEALLFLCTLTFWASSLDYDNIVKTSHNIEDKAKLSKGILMILSSYPRKDKNYYALKQFLLEIVGNCEKLRLKVALALSSLYITTPNTGSFIFGVLVNISGYIPHSIRSSKLFIGTMNKVVKPLLRAVKIGV